MRNPIPVINVHSTLGRQAGVGLIEVLIAVLMLSIGFLGMAALQARALANNSSAMLRTQATIATYEIVDAMRADRINALALAYNTTVFANACPNVGGSLASSQLHQWCTGSGGAVPDGLAALGSGATGHIHCDIAGNCQITVTFDDALASGGTSAQPVSTWVKL